MKKKNKWKIIGIISTIILILILAILFFGCKTKYLPCLALNISLPFNQSNSDSSGSSGETIYSCRDSDDGKSYYMAGYTEDQNSIRSYDKCSDKTLLTEYFCQGDRVDSINFACPLGYYCYETRSGDFCEPLPTWSDGDVVGSGGDSGSSSAPTNSFEIDLSNDFIPGTGTCGLMATINAGWTYGNQGCQGIQGQEGVVFEFWDSDSLEWSRVDSSPTYLGSATECVLDYDGTPFRFNVNKLTDLYPECEIDYEWDVTILACGC